MQLVGLGRDDLALHSLAVHGVLLLVWLGFAGFLRAQLHTTAMSSVHALGMQLTTCRAWHL